MQSAPMQSRSIIPAEIDNLHDTDVARLVNKGARDIASAETDPLADQSLFDRSSRFRGYQTPGSRAGAVIDGACSCTSSSGLNLC